MVDKMSNVKKGLLLGLLIFMLFEIEIIHKMMIESYAVTNLFVGPDIDKNPDVEKLYELCKQNLSDEYFLDVVKDLPDNPAIIEYMLNKGWIYRSDSSIYGTLNHYPHISEIAYEISIESNAIKFVGDCTTKTILFGSILESKNIPYRIILTEARETGMGHAFVDYQGRLDVILRETRIVSTKKELLWKDNVYEMENTSNVDKKSYEVNMNDLNNVHGVNEIVKWKKAGIKLLGLLIIYMLGGYLAVELIEKIRKNKDEIKEYIKLKIKGWRKHV